MKRHKKHIHPFQWLLLFLFVAQPIRGQDIQWLTPKVMDLGRVQQGTIIKDTIRFVNTSEGIVTIEKVQTGCGCTVAKIENKEIAPGDTGHVGFSLKTKGFRGVVRKSIRITLKEFPQQTRLVILQVHAFTNIDFDPPFLFFDNVFVNPDTTYHLTFSVRNNSDHSIQLNRIYTNDSSLVVLPNKLAMNAGTENSIHVQFRPKDASMMYFPIMLETDDPVQKTVTYRFHVRFKEPY